MSPITVKFTAKGHRTKEAAEVFRRQLPGADDCWGRFRFVFEPNCDEYDAFVAYDDLAPVRDERFSSRVERLACPIENTLFITMEPTTIKTYGYDFLDQFGAVITSQEPWAVRNERAVFTQPALRWFYGAGRTRLLYWDEIAAIEPLNKTGDLSAVCSTKKQKNTVHGDRYAFTMRLKQLIPEMELFGRGIRPIDDKANALDSFRYHIVIENHVAEHHWTEKFADAFLGLTLPFYFGCPNATDYFPADSFIRIDVHDPDGAATVIREAIATRQFEQRLPAIREARRRVLHEYNLFAVIASELESRFVEPSPERRGHLLYSRHASRRRSFRHAARFTLEHWKRSLSRLRRRGIKRAA